MSDEELALIKRQNERNAKQNEQGWRSRYLPNRHRTALLAEVDHQRAEIERLRAEIERLRKALQDIAEDCDDDYPPSHGAIKYAVQDALRDKP